MSRRVGGQRETVEHHHLSSIDPHNNSAQIHRGFYDKHQHSVGNRISPIGGSTSDEPVGYGTRSAVSELQVPPHVVQSDDFENHFVSRGGLNLDSDEEHEMKQGLPIPNSVPQDDNTTTTNTVRPMPREQELPRVAGPVEAGTTQPNAKYTHEERAVEKKEDKPKTLQICLLILALIVLVIVFVLIGCLIGYLIFHNSDDSVVVINTSESKEDSNKVSVSSSHRTFPAPYCAFGRSSIQSTLTTVSSRTNALAIKLENRELCQHLCEAIESCMRAVFSAEEEKQCFLELTDTLNCNTTLQPNVARQCSVQFGYCVVYHKACSCPPVATALTTIESKRHLEQLAFALQCTDGKYKTSDEYLMNICNATNSTK